MFYYEKRDGIYRTRVIVSAEKTVVYEFQNSFVSKTEISSKGFKCKNKSRSESRLNIANTVQIGYTYDQSLEMSHPNNFEDYLNYLMSDVEMMYFANDINMESLPPIKIVLGPSSFENNFSLFLQLNNIWVNKICLEVDGAHHITTYQNAPQGHSQGSNMCNLGNDDFKSTYSRHPLSGEFIKDRAAHEIGHSLGATHTENINPQLCDGTTSYFMCTDGADNLDPTQYSLSSQNINSILSNIEDADCTDTLNTSDCIFCEMKYSATGVNGEGFSSLESGGTGLALKINEKDCSVDELGEGSFKIATTGGCNTEARTFTLKLNKYGSENLTDIEFTQIPEGFTLIEDNNNHMKYRGTMFPGMNDDMEKEFKYKVNRMSGIPFPNSSGSSTLYPRTVIQVDVTNQAGGGEGAFDILVSADFWYAKFVGDAFGNLTEALAEKFGTTVNTIRSAACGTGNFDSPLRFILDIDGAMRLQEENCIMANSEINFGPGSSIYLKYEFTIQGGIETPASLFIDNSKLDACGNQKWQGIIASDPGNIIINNSSINNANIALECRGSRSLNVSNSTFTNNYIGIDMESLPDEDFMLDGFSSNTFTANSEYLPTYSFASTAPFAGMVATRIPLVMVNKSSFSNMSNGIVLLNSNGIVGGVGGESDFTNIVGTNSSNLITSDIDGNAIYLRGQGNTGIFLQNNFNSNYRAIGVKEANSFMINNTVRGGEIGFDVFEAQNRITRILNNDIEIDHHAIKLRTNSPAQEMTVSDNTIHVTEDQGIGILVNEFITSQDYNITDNPMIKIHDKSAGILVYSGGGNLIQNNQIIAEAGKKDISESVGIGILGSNDNVFCDNTIRFPISSDEDEQTKGIFLSAGSNNHLSCNYTSGATYGINTWGFTDSQIRNNTFTGNYTGLYYGLYPSEGNANTGQQDYMKNVWKNGTFQNGLYGAEHLSNDQFIVDLSRYLVDDTDQPFTTDYDTPENAVTNWISNLPISGNQNFSCENDLCDSNPSLAFTFGGQSSNNPTFAFSVANGIVDLSNNYNDEQNWIADFHLYNILERKEDRGEYVHPALGNFTNAVSNEILSLGEVNELATAVLTESTSISNASNSILQEVEYILDNYETLSKQDYNTKLNFIGSYNTQLQALFSSHNTDKVTNIQSIINNLPSRNNTTSGYYADAYEQALNLIGNNSINIQKLNSLASMCPIEAGEAVYLARQILKTLGQSNIYDDIAACDRPDSAPRVSSNEHRGQIVNLYPNPTSGVLHFDTKENIVAVSVSGATNSFVKVELKDNFIDISNYLPGMYLVKIEMQSGDIIFEKIVLAK